MGDRPSAAKFVLFTRHYHYTAKEQTHDHH